MSKLRPKKPDQTIKTKAGRKARKGIFSRIAAGESSRAGVVGFRTDRQLVTGQGGGGHINMKKLAGKLPGHYTPGPARR